MHIANSIRVIDLMRIGFCPTVSSRCLILLPFMPPNPAADMPAGWNSAFRFSLSFLYSASNKTCMDHSMHGLAIAVSLLLRVCTGSFRFLAEEWETLKKEKKIPHSETSGKEVFSGGGRLDLIGSPSSEDRRRRRGNRRRRFCRNRTGRSDCTVPEI